MKVQAAALDFTELAALSGYCPGPPEGGHYGLGWDIAGVVDAVGPGAPWKPGQPVIALNYGVPMGLNRAHAEYVVVPSYAIAAAPAGADPVHAATIPLNGLTPRPPRYATGPAAPPRRGRADRCRAGAPSPT
ncbi:alcohol dehydrogenase catalytic domain-containing protein [Streptomyces sp. NPDC004561]